jgi:16S rRNA C1402 (ribose-2'-O) methylase RsmI
MAGDGSIPARGEVVLVVSGRDASAAPTGDEEQPGRASMDDGRARVQALVGEGVPRSEAARRVASETGLSRRDLYRAP